MAIADERMLLLERRLSVLTTARPDLAEALELEQQLIRTSIEAPRPPQTQQFPLPREHLAARLREGVPLLHDQPAHIDLHFATDLFSRLVNVLQERADPDLAGRLEPLLAAVSDGALDPQRQFVEAFVNHHDHLAELAYETGVDAVLLARLARRSVAPILRAYAERLRPMIERLDETAPHGGAWQRGYCQVCGAWPVLGEMGGVEQTPSLRCAGCGSGWQVRRTGCPFCRNDDPNLLQTLTVEGLPTNTQVSACDRCHRYLKVGRAFDPTPVSLGLDDVASQELDAAAIERGYHRPQGSGFVIELAVPEEAWVEELDED